MNSKSKESSSTQFVVRFANSSHVIHLPPVSGSISQNEKEAHLLTTWSERTGWPSSRLEIASWSFPFVSLRVKSCIRGGKGGFGTLLKGQSRQAGAKLTTDFGACRDLQGRRLRHVNDEIKLRKWREIKRREEAGEKIPDDELWKTPSGIYNWHLMTPTWADISKKAAHRIKRQFQLMDKQAQKEVLKKQERDELYKNSMEHYLEKATEATETIQESIGDAIQQGLSASKKRKRQAESSTPADTAEPNSLVTLSGELVVEESNEAGMQLQSKSDFGTAVLVLDRTDLRATLIYYEVTLVTGGMAQIGWANLLGDKAFLPNDDLGDGVGDDEASYAVDGTRKLKFHAGKEEAYALEWKEGDRLGCWLNTKDGIIGFSVNGKDFGPAFELEEKSAVLVPAFSSNQGQILRLHTTRDDCKYFPTGSAVAVGDLVVTETGSDGAAMEEDTRKPAAAPIPKPSTTQVTPPPPAPRAPKKEIAPEPLDLESYSSAQELEELGLDRLKSALLALQVKCGGTLNERALRLFSLKGLARKDFPKKVRAKGFVL